MQSSQSTLVHVGVRSTNLEDSVRFWRDALGLNVIASPPGSYDLTDGYHNFRVFQHGGAERPPHIGGMLDYLHIGVRVDNLQETAQRCKDLGFEIFWDGVDGGQEYDPSVQIIESFKVADPDGIAVDVSASPDQWPGVELS
jgi:catechol 2,3-dioxygenase-like lactoylglutathione lyase family enzyme